MQPDCESASTDFSMNRFAFWIVRYTSGGKAKRFNKKIVRSWDVLANEERNDSVDSGHVVFLYVEGGLTPCTLKLTSMDVEKRCAQ